MAEYPRYPLVEPPAPGADVVNPLEEISETSAMRREINRGLMRTWINRDLAARAGCDIDKSVVAYDRDGLFLYAAPACWVPEPATEHLLWHRLWDVGGRAWSRGIV